MLSFMLFNIKYLLIAILRKRFDYFLRENSCKFKISLYLCTAFNEKHFSAINTDYQWFIKNTPDFTPDNVKLGVFVLFKI